MSVIDWLLDGDPAIRWQVLADLTDAPAGDVAAERAQVEDIVKTHQMIIAQWRNRIEASFGEITEQMGLARHGAHTFWDLLTRTAGTIAAHTLMRVCPAAA